jgi:predicted nucleic acid-binding protein
MICLDASFVAAAMMPDEKESSGAQKLIEQWLESGMPFVAPDLWAYEIVSLVFKAVTRGRLSEERGASTLTEMFRFPITLVRPSSYEQAYAIALTYRLPAAYDAQYLAVAEAEGIEFWTGDKKLYDRVHAALRWVHWLGEGEASSA